MTKTEYLYGVKPHELIDIRPALQDRISKAKVLLKELTYKDEMKDFKRIDDVLSAISWCQNLIKEYEENSDNKGDTR